MTPVHKLTCCEVERLMFVRNKSIIKAFNFKLLILLTTSQDVN